MALSEIKTKFQSILRLIFIERRINTIQIIDILNSSNNWVMKWLVKRESVPGKLPANAKSLKIIQKYQSIEVFQLYETKEKMAKCYSLLCRFHFFNNFEDTFAVLPLAFSMLTSPVYPRNSRFAGL